MLKKSKRTLQIAAMSDTHSQHDYTDLDIFGQTDIFIHAGDFTMDSRID